LALTNVTVEKALERSISVQNTWKTGNISRYDIVDSFLDELLPPNEYEEMHVLLDRVNILVTTVGEGATVNRATSHEELRELLIRTTWM